MSTRSLDNELLTNLRATLAEANAAFNHQHPGESESRQPVHTVYGGAQLFKRDTTVRMSAQALRALTTYAPTADALATALGWQYDNDLASAASLGRQYDRDFASNIYQRVVAKLEREAVEDFRIDFEDGFGNRPDAEEDAEAERCATELAAGLADSTLPPFSGIRIKPFSQEMVARALRTLDIFVTALVRATGGALPPNFVITLPKVTHPQQVRTCVAALAAIERATGLADGALQIELMVETPQSIFDNDGRVALPALVTAGGGRVRGAHFGTYDYTALCNITAAHQHMMHPACDFARHAMQVSLAQRGLLLSDGATNVMPVGPHRAADGGELTPEQQHENREVVLRAWRLSYDHIRHSLTHAFYQGWDLHPAQLPIRYAALYSFFLEGLKPATARLQAFMGKAAQATLLGDVFDDAATGQGLLNFFLRGIASGAITEEEAFETGLTLDEIRTRSFLRILDGRRGAAPATAS